MNINNHKLWVLPFALGIGAALGACSSDSNNNDGAVAPGVGSPAKLLVNRDLGNDVGVLDSYVVFEGGSVSLGDVKTTLSGGLAESIVVDAAGTVYQSGISGGLGAISALCAVDSRFGATMVTSTNDRNVSVGLSAPKGMALAQKVGLVIATESGAVDHAAVVYSSSAADAAAPVYVIPRSVVGGTGAWDAAYDEKTDRLFLALVNGTVAYFADYLANATGAAASAPLMPTAVFSPDNPLPSASNMHGIVYDADADRLFVSDVADASVADDGSLYVFGLASTLSGAVTPDRTIRGAASMLGNPVDLQLYDGDLYVAEKANQGGKILVFRNIATGGSGNIAADYSFAVGAPESISISDPDAESVTGSSDLASGEVEAIYVTSNPANTGTSVLTLSSDFSPSDDTFMPLMSGQYIESIGLGPSGDGLVTFDDAATPSSGGFSFASRLSSRNTGGFDLMKDRQIVGSESGLISPKGFDVIGPAGLVLVADLEAAAPGSVKAYSLCAAGNVGPVFTTTLPGSVRPWDVDYDPEADRLFVAATNGTVLVYDAYLETRPATPDRIIDPDDQSGFPISNIHGIIHDAATDRLILSDVGDAAVADDGRIYVIDGAATAEGLTALRLEIAGASSALGNPVDIAFVGDSLYVAEKSNNQIQKFVDIYGKSGLLDLIPDLSTTVVAPESVAIEVK